MNTQKIYDGVIDLAVDNNSHTKAYNLIIEDTNGTGRILEVGCSKGYFGSCLSDTGYEVWGVEPSQAAAKTAGKYLHTVFHGDINDFYDTTGGVKFDHIVFGDIIEHLLDPIEVLIRSHSFLAPGGSIVASIPNVAHMAVRAMLFEGRWQYADQGILDDTHLRFYTRETILELFSKAGFRVEKIDCVTLPVDVVSDMCQMQINQSLAADLEPLVLDDEKEVFQYVIKAVVDDKLSLVAPANQTKYVRKSAASSAAKPETNVLCIVPFHDCTLSKIRLIDPLRAWASAYCNGSVKVVVINEITNADVLWADVAVYQREANDYSLRIVAEMKRVGLPLVFDLDDLLTEVPEFLSVYEHALRSRGKLLKILRLADVITVTQGRLAEKIKPISGNVKIIPNCADALPLSNGHDHQGQVNLLVASSDTVRVDFVRDVLDRVKSELGDGIEIIGIGPPGEWLRQNGVPVRAHPIMSNDKFKKLISELPNAIGIIPLDDSEFSSCKSPIKFIDYSLAAVPSICSNVAPYSDCVINDKTGKLVENDSDAWYAAIIELAKSPTQRAKLVATAKTDCEKNFSMRRSADAWDSLFEALVDRDPSKTVSSAQRIFAKDYDRLFVDTTNILQKIIGTLKSDGIHGLLSIAKRKTAYSLKL